MRLRGQARWREAQAPAAPTVAAICRRTDAWGALEALLDDYLRER